MGHAAYHHGWWNLERPITPIAAQMNVGYALAAALIDGAAMVARNITPPFQLICLTDSSIGIRPEDMEDASLVSEAVSSSSKEIVLLRRSNRASHCSPRAASPPSENRRL